MNDMYRWPCPRCHTFDKQSQYDYRDTVNGRGANICFKCPQPKPGYLDPERKDIRWMCSVCFPAEAGQDESGRR